jgi:hypothetical protein
MNRPGQVASPKTVRLIQWTQLPTPEIPVMIGGLLIIAGGAIVTW